MFNLSRFNVTIAIRKKTAWRFGEWQEDQDSNRNNKNVVKTVFLNIAIAIVLLLVAIVAYQLFVPSTKEQASSTDKKVSQQTTKNEKAGKSEDKESAKKKRKKNKSKQKLRKKLKKRS